MFIGGPFPLFVRHRNGGHVRIAEPGPNSAPDVGLGPPDLEAARRREPQAVARMYRAHAPGLYRFIVASIGDRHVAEDLVAGVFANAMESLPSFRGSLEAFGGWLYRIARHDLAEHRRGVARDPGDQLEDRLEEAAWAQVAPDRHDAVLNRLDGGRMYAAMERLSSDEREVLLLRMGAGLSTAQVATAVGRSVGSVKALQHRALTALARLLAGDEETGRP